MKTLHQFLVEAASRHGFVQSGGVDIESAKPEYLKHVTRYDRWLDCGFAGEMNYLKNTERQKARDKRADPRILFSKAQSVFCGIFPYALNHTDEIDKDSPQIAAYTKGIDYHTRVKDALERALGEANQKWIADNNPSFEWQTGVDTRAVLERTWANLAGLGWIGKNTLLIHPKWGSAHFIAVAFLSVELGQGPRPHANYCGACTRCLRACPTQAFVEAGVLDARKCISYLTLEKRGPHDASPELLKKMGTWVAGCDVCQDVCPFNFKLPKEIPQKLHWDELMNETPEAYRARVKGTALERVKPSDSKRNTEQAIQNRKLI